MLHALALTHGAVGVAEVLLLDVPNIAEETLQLIALTADEDVSERIASDSELISKYPQLIARLLTNPKTRMHTADRLYDRAKARGIELDLSGQHGPPEEDVQRRRAARRRARKIATAPPLPPTAKPEPPPSEAAPAPRAPRINLMPFPPTNADLLLRGGQRALSWLNERIDDWRKARQRSRSTSAILRS